MSESTTSKPSRDKIDAVLRRFKFFGYADGRGWPNDEYFLARLVRQLKDDIDKALPALQPGDEIECGWDRLTSDERAYSAKFFYLQNESLIIEALREGWSIRRIHREMVAMLRALIALDAENLAEYDVVVPSEEVAKVEQGTVDVTDLAVAELQRLPRTKAEGHMLRYGIYLGLAMALEGKTGHADLADLARSLIGQVGAKDPLERPSYRMDARSAEFLQEMRAQRDAKENS